MAASAKTFILFTRSVYVLKSSSKRLEDVFATRLEDVLKTSSKRLETVLARRLEDILKTSSKCLENVFKTSGQDEYIGLDQDVLKTSWRHLLKT